MKKVSRKTRKASAGARSSVGKKVGKVSREQYVLLSANAGGADEHPRGQERKIVRIVPAHRAEIEREKLLLDAFHERYKDYREQKLRKMQNFVTFRYILIIMLVIYIAVFLLTITGHGL